MSASGFFTPSIVSAQANPKAVFQFPTARFSLLTSRLIRIETSENGVFEDRPSQVFWYRDQPLPKASISQTSTRLTIDTEYFTLTFQANPENLPSPCIEVLVKESGATVHLDDPNPGLLPGTIRTLDETDGSVPLNPGVLSRSGWVQLEDTRSLVFNAEGWLEPRKAAKGYRDLTLLVSGSDYRAALKDYQLVAGLPGLIPRAFLGNWWSRFWEYTQEDIQNLVNQFHKEEIPLSVFIIDMDWHVTKTGNACSGWTGFSWNRSLIPDPDGLLQWLHGQGLITALNLHPAEGIHPHEDQYLPVAQAMGISPKKNEPIPFDIANPLFARVYFDKVLRPLEDQGVDFWWLDWQQGELSQLPGLDPLWWLNHLHYYEQGRDKQKRPVIFSRWGGPGSHRYPIGFSGDTVISWESLAFQPWFTACAANTAFGWWSHDIGGHMRGMEDRELYVRWVQFGVLSPIFRLHCTKDLFIDRHPWGFDAEVTRLTRDAMQFRHALIPYLYTMARRNSEQGLALICPLYYEWPDEESAYWSSNQYLLGDQLMAAPVTSPGDVETGRTKHAIWLPPGEWYDFFSGARHTGPGWEINHYALEETPLFAKSGAILPMQADILRNGVENPAAFNLLVFPGRDGNFTLYEDDGTSQDYLEQGGASTHFQSKFTPTSLSVSVSPVSGDTRPIPETRSYTISFRGVSQPENISAWIDGQPCEISFAYAKASRTTQSTPISIRVDQELTVKISNDEYPILADNPSPQSELIKLLKDIRTDTTSKWKINSIFESLQKDIRELSSTQINLSERQKIAVIETITGVGAMRVKHPQSGDQIVLVNPDQHKGFKYGNLKPREIGPGGVVIPAAEAENKVDYMGLVKSGL